MMIFSFNSNKILNKLIKKNKNQIIKYHNQNKIYILYKMNKNSV